MKFPLEIENLFRSVCRVIVLFCLYITLVDPFLPCRCIVFVCLDKYSPLFVASFALYFSASINSMFIVSVFMHIWQLHVFEWTVFFSDCCFMTFFPASCTMVQWPSALLKRCLCWHAGLFYYIYLFSYDHIFLLQLKEYHQVHTTISKWSIFISFSFSILPNSMLRSWKNI